MNGLQFQKQLTTFKNRARSLDIHNPDLDRRLIESLKEGTYNASLLQKQNDGFWFRIPGKKPLWAYIRRIGMCQFALYITFDKIIGVKKKQRTFGKGGNHQGGASSVTLALDELFREAFATVRAMPVEETPLPLFATLETPQEEAIPA